MPNAHPYKETFLRFFTKLNSSVKLILNRVVNKIITEVSLVSTTGQIISEDCLCPKLTSTELAIPDGFKQTIH